MIIITSLGDLIHELAWSAGLPATAVVFIGTTQAIYHCYRSAHSAAQSVEDGALALFGSSSRRVRAWGIFVISHFFAVIVTLVTAKAIIDHGRLLPRGMTPPHLFIITQISTLLFFALIDWYNFRYGDGNPAFIAFNIAIAGSLIVLACGVRAYFLDLGEPTVLAWVTAAILWWRSFGWAASTGADLARTLQNRS